MRQAILEDIDLGAEDQPGDVGRLDPRLRAGPGRVSAVLRSAQVPQIGVIAVGVPAGAPDGKGVMRLQIGIEHAHSPREGGVELVAVESLPDISAGVG